MFLVWECKCNSVVDGVYFYDLSRSDVKHHARKATATLRVVVTHTSRRCHPRVYYHVLRHLSTAPLPSRLFSIIAIYTTLKACHRGLSCKASHFHSRNTDSSTSSSSSGAYPVSSSPFRGSLQSGRESNEDKSATPRPPKSRAHIASNETMASHVVVIDSALKRAQIKVTPQKYLSDVLEEACSKLGHKPEQYTLK